MSSPSNVISIADGNVVSIADWSVRRAQAARGNVAILRPNAPRRTPATRGAPGASRVTGGGRTLAFTRGDHRHAGAPGTEPIEPAIA